MCRRKSRLKDQFQQPVRCKGVGLQGVFEEAATSLHHLWGDGNNLFAPHGAFLVLGAPREILAMKVLEGSLDLTACRADSDSPTSSAQSPIVLAIPRAKTAELNERSAGTTSEGSVKLQAELIAALAFHRNETRRLELDAARSQVP